MKENDKLIGAESRTIYYEATKRLRYRGCEYHKFSKGKGTIILDDPVWSMAIFFKGCSELTSINIPDSITYIDDEAFGGCTALTSISIPNSVTKIGRRVFLGCTGLTSISIPESVTYIGENAFKNTGWYNNQPDGILYLDGWCLGYKGAKPIGTLTIAEGTKCIAPYAFSECSGLTSVTIPDSVTTISFCAFSGCSGLPSINIPNSIKCIGQYAFYGCSGLTSINIPDSVTEIGRYAFAGCIGLTSINIPDSVTKIDQYAFAGCERLQFNEYDNAYYLGNDANRCVVLFKAVSKDITSCNIDTNCNLIYKDAFSGCSGLKSINIPDSVTSIGNGAFSNCHSLKSVTLPDSVKVIGEYAFCCCENLSSIIIPDSVTEIGDYAFGGYCGYISADGCKSLPNETKEKIMKINKEAFKNIVQYEF